VNEIKPRKLYQKTLYRIGQVLSRILFTLFWRLKIDGHENIPKTGAFILASNHLSNADPPLLGSSICRPIYYFAKEELFRIPILGWLIAQMNAFPVKRKENDIAAFKKTFKLLSAGEGVLFFPEGRRSKTGELGGAKPGVGMLAVKTGVPVIPACLQNSNRLSSFAKLRVSFGKPLLPQPQDDYALFAQKVMAAIADLKSKMYNGSSSKKP